MLTQQHSPFVWRRATRCIKCFSASYFVVMLQQKIKLCLNVVGYSTDVQKQNILFQHKHKEKVNVSLYFVTAFYRMHLPANAKNSRSPKITLFICSMVNRIENTSDRMHVWQKVFVLFLQQDKTSAISKRAQTDAQCLGFVKDLSETYY